MYNKFSSIDILSLLNDFASNGLFFVVNWKRFFSSQLFSTLTDLSQSFSHMRRPFKNPFNCTNMLCSCYHMVSCIFKVSRLPFTSTLHCARKLIVGTILPNKFSSCTFLLVHFCTFHSCSGNRDRLRDFVCERCCAMPLVCLHITLIYTVHNIHSKYIAKGRVIVLYFRTPWHFFSLHFWNPPSLLLFICFASIGVTLGSETYCNCIVTFTVVPSLPLPLVSTVPAIGSQTRNNAMSLRKKKRHKRLNLNTCAKLRMFEWFESVFCEPCVRTISLNNRFKLTSPWKKRSTY